MFKVNNKDTRTTSCSSVSMVNFEQVKAGWDPSVVLIRNLLFGRESFYSSESAKFEKNLEKVFALLFELIRK